MEQLCHIRDAISLGQAIDKSNDYRLWRVEKELVTKRQLIRELTRESERSHDLVTHLVTVNTSLIEENDILREHNWEMYEQLRKGGYMATAKKTVKKATKKATKRSR